MARCPNSHNAFAPEMKRSRSKSPQLLSGLTGKALKNPNLPCLESQLKTAYRIADTFPDAVYQTAEELNELSSSEKAGLEDLRALTFVTIDGEDARDFDDAIAVEKNAQGFRLWVAIADVSRYVPKTRQNRTLSLDAEAQRRGNSFYFPTSVAPMLPPRLSTDLASLRQDAERPVMVCELWLTAAGEVRKSRFSQALIRSACRLSYTEVKGLLLTPDPAVKARLLALPKANDILRLLADALSLSEILRAQRRSRGSLFLRSYEPCYRLDAEGRIIDLGFRLQHQGHSLIEECMILANEACAEHLSQSGLPMLYRTHAQPTQEDLAQLQKTLSHCQAALPLDLQQRALLPQDLPKLLKACQGSACEQAVTTLCLRALPKALYSTENTGHFGLASACYCHFTSPIRRYADLLVHRALKHSLGSRQLLLAHKRLEMVASHLNRQEELAQHCQREMHKYCSVLYLRQRLGQVFQALVSHVSQAGFFVELTDIPVSGFVAKRLLPASLRLDLAKQRLFDAQTGQSYQFGDSLLVRLISVWPDKAAINFLPVAKKGPSKIQARAARRRKTAKEAAFPR